MSFIIAKLVNKKLLLPEEISKRVISYWENQKSINKSLFNGEAFHLNTIIKVGDKFEIELIKSDYAHYLYSKNIGDLGDYNFNTLHTSVVVLTSDNYFILGKMNNNTALPQTIQFCGGGLDFSDIKEDGFIDFDGNIKREIKEELHVSDCKPRFFHFYSNNEKNRHAVIFYLQLDLNKDDFSRYFLSKNNINDEFSELVFLKNKKSKLMQALDNKNIDKLVKFILNKYHASFPHD